MLLIVFRHIYRALTSDLIMPLPSLKEIRLDGNDISMVAKNAFNGVKSLEILSLRDNPLSCDCSLKPFAEWMLRSKIRPEVYKSCHDLLGLIWLTNRNILDFHIPEIFYRPSRNAKRHLEEVWTKAKRKLPFVSRWSVDFCLMSLCFVWRLIAVNLRFSQFSLLWTRIWD